MDKSVEINLDILYKSSMDAESFFICWAKFNDIDLEEYIKRFGDMAYNKYLRLVQSGMLMSKASIFNYNNVEINYDLFRKYLNVPNVKDFIDDWYDLWPKGVRSGGYLVRSGKSSCQNKMKTFMREYPKFTPEIIMRATSDYIRRFSVEGYNFMKLATNFIKQGKESALAGECEQLLDNVSEVRSLESTNISTQKSLFGEQEF